MKNAQLKIYTKERSHLAQLQTPPKVNIKSNKERPVSSIQGAIKRSPTSQSGIGLRKLNLNVNVNVNNNETNLPQIGPVSPLIMHTDVNGNMSHNMSTINTQKTPNRTRIKENRRDLTPNYNRDANSVKKLQTEIAQKRADYIRLESELKQKDKLIEELVKIEKQTPANLQTIPSYQQGGGIKNKELALILSLKRQVKEMHKDLKTKDDALETLRKQAKLTKLNEYELEIKTLNAELVKLKELYETSASGNQINPKEYQFLQESHAFQQNLINSLQEYNNKMIQEIKDKDDKINKLKEKNKELEERLEKLQSNGGTFVVNDSEAINKLKAEQEARTNELLKEIQTYKEQCETKENKLKEMEEYYDKASQEVKGFYRTLTSKDKYKIEELIKKLNEKENDLNLIKELIHQNSLKFSTEVENMSYLLRICLIVKGVSYDQLQSSLEHIYNTTEESDVTGFIEKASEKILVLLKNNNSNNKVNLINYFNCLSILDPKDFKTIKENLQDSFLSYMGTIDVSYSEEETSNYIAEIKKHLNQFRSEIMQKISNHDKNKTGFIPYQSLEDIFDITKYELDKDLIDFIMIRMKSYEDSNSNLTDLKYSLVTDLLDDVEAKRQSLALSSVCLPIEEAEQRLEGLFKNIAEYLYNKGVGTRNVFSSTILIQDKNVRYNAMYLAIFLSVLKDEMKLNIDATDSICLFNKLKNVTNIFCVELVDIDILVMELKDYGIKEYVDEVGKNIKDDVESKSINENPVVNQNYVRQRTSTKLSTLKSITGTHKIIKESHQITDETFDKAIEKLMKNTEEIKEEQANTIQTEKNKSNHSTANQENKIKKKVKAIPQSKKENPVETKLTDNKVEINKKGKEQNTNVSGKKERKENIVDPKKKPSNSQKKNNSKKRPPNKKKPNQKKKQGEEEEEETEDNEEEQEDENDIEEEQEEDNGDNEDQQEDDGNEGDNGDNENEQEEDGNEVQDEEGSENQEQEGNMNNMLANEENEDEFDHQNEDGNNIDAKADNRGDESANEQTSNRNDNEEEANENNKNGSNHEDEEEKEENNSDNNEKEEEENINENNDDAGDDGGDEDGGGDDDGGD